VLEGPKQDVEVVGHQAVSQQSHAMAHHRLREDALECRKRSVEAYATRTVMTDLTSPGSAERSCLCRGWGRGITRERPRPPTYC
jgi:hypothetical protein